MSIHNFSSPTDGIVPAKTPGLTFETKGNHPNIADQRYRIDDRFIDENPQIVADCLREGFTIEHVSAASTPIYKASIVEMVKDPHRIGPIVRKGMTEGNASGGALVPIQWIEPILAKPGTQLLQSRVTTVPTATLTTRHPRVKTTDARYPAYPVVASWAGETPASPAEQGANLTVEQIDLAAHELYCYGQVSISLAEDTRAPQLLTDIFNRTVATTTDNALITGDGTDRPYGINEAVSGTPVISSTTTGTAGTIVYDDIVNVYYSLPEQYRATSAFLCNSNTLKALAKIKDSQGLPIIQPNASGTSPHGTIFGRDILVSQFLPDPTTGNIALYVADWSQTYVMTQRLAPTVRILDQPGYKNGVYECVLRCRRGGRVLFPDAARSLKLA